MRSACSVRTPSARSGGPAALGSARFPAAGRIGRGRGRTASRATWRSSTRRASSCASLDGDAVGYRIRARLWDGREVEFDDPYRFGPQISDSDLYLHTEGTLYEGWRALGAHLATVDGVPGRALRRVGAECGERHASPASSTIGTSRRHPMRRRNGGVWELFIPGLGEGTSYKYNVRSRFAGYQQLKADPYAFYCETPPKSASRRLGPSTDTSGSDAAWMEARAQDDLLKSPMSVYEVHLESLDARARWASRSPIARWP